MTYQLNILIKLIINFDIHSDVDLIINMIKTEYKQYDGLLLGIIVNMINKYNSYITYDQYDEEYSRDLLDENLENDYNLYKSKITKIVNVMIDLTTDINELYKCLFVAIKYDYYYIAEKLLSDKMLFKTNELIANDNIKSAFIYTCENRNVKIAKLFLNANEFNPSENSNEALKMSIGKCNSIANMIIEHPKYNK